MLKDILKRGDSSRKMYIKEKIAPFNQTLLSLRLSETNRYNCS